MAQKSAKYQLKVIVDRNVNMPVLSGGAVHNAMVREGDTLGTTIIRINATEGESCVGSVCLKDPVR